MRGKGVIVQNYCISSRITPAYAGKRVVGGFVGQLSRDHPRLCGEKGSFLKTSFPCVGSPPPMRGKGPDCFGDCPHDGITPAYAGKSCSSNHVFT